MDLDFNGPAFTWRGMRNVMLLEKCLDRGLINRLWHDLWPNTTVTHGTVLGSDHYPLIIQTEPACKRGRKVFRFEAFWEKRRKMQRGSEKMLGKARGWEYPCAVAEKDK